MQTRFIFALYRAFQVAVFPLFLLYALSRGVRDRRYFRRLTERFGALPPHFQRTVRDSVWLHAVSVGEVLSAIELIRQLRRELPSAPVFVSCTTLAGRDAAESRLSGLADGVFYAPVDYVFAVRRVMRRIRPAVLIVLETEIWPNLWREIRRAGCALVVVNARISDKALPKYQRWRWLFRHVLSLPDWILAQSELQRERYIAAGAPADRVLAAGNLKYDFNPAAEAIAQPVKDWIERGSGPIWVAASTVAPEFDGDVDEDDAVISAWRDLSGVRLMIAPRKPDRFEPVATKLERAGIRFARRTRLTNGVDAPVLLLDSVGELSALFRYADLVFMGGTLAHRGGHNILEPALFERPVIAGPHLENFTEIQKRFREGEALIEINEPNQLASAVQWLLSDAAAAAEFGRRARGLAEQERGVTPKAVQAVVNARWSAVPRAVPYGPLVPLLRLLSLVWIAGGAVKRRLRQTGRLPMPVISIGGIAMGGAGKTPAVRYLARVLFDGGLNAAVLTRGYRRRSAEAITLLPRAAAAPVSVTGDEAQTILRDGTAYLGIGADRLAVGRALAERFHPDLFILDDGFQHSRLHRDLDVVLLDGLDPFAGGAVFPVGRLREPITALGRAAVIVISRSEGRRFEGVLRTIRRANQYAPVLFTKTVPIGWVDSHTGERRSPAELRNQTVSAFCGLANPESFRQTLLSIGCVIARFRAFPDHHTYSEHDMSELSRMGDGILITTEKDAVKIAALKPPKLTYLEIAIRITDLDLPQLK